MAKAAPKKVSKLEQPVHNMVGYGVLFAFALIVLLVVMSYPLG